jgi:hypothetical protein
MRKVYRFLFIKFNPRTYSKKDTNNWKKTILIIICSILITITFTYLITFVNSILLRNSAQKVTNKTDQTKISCSPLFNEINGICNAFHRGPSTADEAHQSCKELRASAVLPIIKNDTDLDAVVLLAKHYNIKEFWVRFCILFLKLNCLI